MSTVRTKHQVNGQKSSRRAVLIVSQHDCLLAKLKAFNDYRKALLERCPVGHPALPLCVVRTDPD